MKSRRHQKILELIQNHPIDTQEELVEKLVKEGLSVTQATVSRDIKELKLVKVQYNENQYRYGQMSVVEATYSDKLLNIFKEAFISCDSAQNMVVVKTLVGMANAVAEAIDSLKISDVLGTIAGDNTIFIVCRSEKAALALIAKFNNLSTH